MVICDSVTADRASTLIMNYDNDENEEDIEYTCIVDFDVENGTDNEQQIKAHG